MPDNTQTERIRQFLQTARQAADALSSALDSLEGELIAMDQAAEDHATYSEDPRDQDPEITFTQEEAEIMLLKMLLNVREAAFLLGIQPTDVYRLIREGKLPVCKIGRRRVRIPVKQLKEYIESTRAGEGEGLVANGSTP